MMLLIRTHINTTEMSVCARLVGGRLQFTVEATDTIAAGETVLCADGVWLGGGPEAYSGEVVRAVFEAMKDPHCKQPF
jgi:hypothetical protein